MHALTWVFKAGTLQNLRHAALSSLVHCPENLLLCFPQLKESAALFLDSPSLDVTWKLFKDSKVEQLRVHPISFSYLRHQHPSSLEDPVS